MSSNPIPDGLAMTTQRGGGRPGSDWPEGTTRWAVTLTFEGLSLKVPFHRGPALVGPPTIEEVLDCLCSDATMVEEARSPEGLAAELGWDMNQRADAIRARRTYFAARTQTDNLRRLLGEHFDAVVYPTQ